MFTPDASRLVTCGWDGLITIWDTASGQSSASLPGPCVGGVISPDGQWLATSGGNPQYGGNADGLIHLWNLASAQAGTSIGQPDALLIQSAFALSPDGQLLASGHPSSYDGGDGVIHLWDTASGAERVSWHQSDTSTAVVSLVFSPDGSLLATADDTGVLYVWDVATQQGLAVLGEAGSSSISQIAFNAGGTLLAVGRGDGSIELWGVPAAK